MAAMAQTAPPQLALGRMTPRGAMCANALVVARAHTHAAGAAADHGLAASAVVDVPAAHLPGWVGIDPCQSGAAGNRLDSKRTRGDDDW